ncbi:MAG TPA: hypothetical protein DEF88_00595 [Porphyromonadaceae bacterium]|nr:hypothetical protein [Porphyromonadaceae bacterium]HCM21111.1 hypothetical protein [Porphyromonadaceae bacterium]
MYTFQIKKRSTSNKDLIEINDFLSKAYLDIDYKFKEGFVQDVINLFDKKLFTSKNNTHGGILDDIAFHQGDRTLDLMINGGVKGLKQYLINEEGSKKEIADTEIVGLKFFARIWIPANSYTGYVFIQKYNNSSLKPLFDEVISNVLDQHRYTIAGKGIVPTTTKKRQENFLKESDAKEIKILLNGSPSDTSLPEAGDVIISFKKLSIKKRDITRSLIKQMMKSSGIATNRDFKYKAVYESDVAGYKEEKTVKENQTFNLVPNTLVPLDCIDENNHPIFEKMQSFVRMEMDQILKEAKAN